MFHSPTPSLLTAAGMVVGKTIDDIKHNIVLKAVNHRRDMAPEQCGISVILSV